MVILARMPAAEAIEIQTVDGPMPALQWLPPSGRGPGILLLQEIFGLSSYIHDRAGALADLGYVVVAPALYWRLGETTVEENRPDYLEHAIGLMSRLDWGRTIDHASAALTAVNDLDEVDDGVGIVGFCFGGGVGFNVAAIADPDAFVCYYGSAVPGLLGMADRVTAPSIYHFGLDDAYIPPDVVEAIRAAVPADAEFHTYPRAGHAFDNPLPAFHSATASAKAWAATTDFLARTLPVRPS